MSFITHCANFICHCVSSVMIMQLSIKCLLHGKPTYRFPDINAFYLVFNTIDKISQTVDYATFIELCKRSLLNKFKPHWENAKMYSHPSFQSPKLDRREIPPMRPLESDADVSVASVVAAAEHHLRSVFLIVHLDFATSDCPDQVVRM